MLIRIITFWFSWRSFFPIIIKSKIALKIIAPEFRYWRHAACLRMRRSVAVDLVQRSRGWRLCKFVCRPEEQRDKDVRLGSDAEQRHHDHLETLLRRGVPEEPGVCAVQLQQRLEQMWDVLDVGSKELFIHQQWMQQLQSESLYV